MTIGLINCRFPMCRPRGKMNGNNGVFQPFGRCQEVLGFSKVQAHLRIRSFFRSDLQNLRKTLRSDSIGLENIGE